MEDAGQKTGGVVIPKWGWVAIGVAVAVVLLIIVVAAAASTAVVSSGSTDGDSGGGGDGDDDGDGDDGGDDDDDEEVAVPLYRIYSNWTQSNINSGGRNYLGVSGGMLVNSPTGMLFIISLNSDNTYTFKSADDPTQVISFVNGTYNGAYLNFSTDTGAATQKWNVLPAPLGTNYDIFSPGNPLRLVPSTATTMSMNLLGTVLPANSPIGLWTADSSGGSLNEKWMLVPVV